MNLLLTLAFPGGPLGLLFKIAIFCVIIWGIVELVKWLAWPIPRPIQIIAIVVACIVVIYWLFELLMIVI